MSCQEAGRQALYALQGSIVVMLIGAVVAGATDLTYSLPGYIWVSICAISTAMYLLLIRALKDSTGELTITLCSWLLPFFSCADCSALHAFGPSGLPQQLICSNSCSAKSVQYSASMAARLLFRLNQVMQLCLTMHVLALQTGLPGTGRFAIIG